MNEDPAKLSLSNFLAGESNDPLQAPASFTNWIRVVAWAAELYEPELLATADARTTITYGGKPCPVINLCSYNYLGLANHPEVLAAAHEALRTHGLGACGSPMLSGMTDLHRELERRVAKFLGREDAMLFNSGFGGALGTISGLLRKTDVALLDNRSHLSLRDGAVLSRCRTEKFEHNDPVSLDTALSRQNGRRQRTGVNVWMRIKAQILQRLLRTGNEASQRAESFGKCAINERNPVLHLKFLSRATTMFATSQHRVGLVNKNARAMGFRDVN
jgi:hypothetical protein